LKSSVIERKATAKATTKTRAGKPVAQTLTNPSSTLNTLGLSLHPGFGQDRFNLLRVKAAFGPSCAALRGLDPKLSGRKRSAYHSGNVGWKTDGQSASIRYGRPGEGDGRGFGG